MTALKTHRHIYSINLMWINKTPASGQWPNYKTEYKQRNTLLEWSKVNPRSKINFWYDGLMSQRPDFGNFVDVYNVRDIPIVEKNRIYFSDKFPVFFRIDILKAIITSYYLQYNKEDNYFVYADNDVKPICDVDLFDTETLSHLQDVGVVVAKSETTCLENSFHIAANNKNVILAFDRILIDLNLKRASNALLGRLKNMRFDLMSLFLTSDTPIATLTESVFYSYYPMLKYLHSLNGKGKIHICPEFNNLMNKIGPDEIYDYKIHGIKHFDTTSVGTGFGLRLFYDGIFIIPTKVIDVPPAKGYYGNHLPASEMSWYDYILSCFTK